MAKDTKQKGSKESKPQTGKSKSGDPSTVQSGGSGKTKPPRK